MKYDVGQYFTPTMSKYLRENAEFDYDLGNYISHFDYMLLLLSFFFVETM